MSHALRQVVLLCLGCAMTLGLWPARSMAQAAHPSVSPAHVRAAAHRVDGSPGSHRLVRLFDFEEARLGNYEDMPQHWYVLGRPANSADPNFARWPLHEEASRRPGYPQFTQVRFDRPQHESGPHAFYMGLDGGHVGAYLEVGAVPAVPGSEYFIAVRVRTAAMTRASARLSAYLIDAAGRPIPATTARSPRVRTQGQWETLGVTLPGDSPDAAWIGIELEVLQPEADPDSPLGSQQIVLEDIRGQAWWDDVAIWQLPQVSVGTQSLVNVVRHPDRPALDLRVRDLMGSELLSIVTLRDAQGHVVDQATRHTGRGHPDQWRWSPRVDRFGWYTVDLAVHELGRGGASASPPPRVARAMGAFLWLPGDEPLPAEQADRLMILADGAPPSQTRWLPELLQQAGLSAVTLSLWDDRTTPATLPERQAHLESIITPLVMRGGRVTLSLSPMPAKLLQAVELDASQTPALLGKDEAHWRPYLLPILMRQGQSIQRWQLGSVHTPPGLAEPALASQLRQTDRRLRTMAPEPQIMLPWPLDHGRRFDLPALAAHLLDVPVAARAEHLGQYLEPWRASPDVPFWLALREPPADRMAQADRLTDLALRMVHGWEAGAAGLALDRPWGWASPRHDALLPDAMLGVFAQVGRRLIGRQAMGRLHIGPGLRAVLFASPDEAGADNGLLVLWNESARDADAQVALHLGQSPVQVDLWGNRQPLVALGGVHRLALQRTPTFIEGVDTRLALMRRSFAVDEPFIASMQTPHRRHVTLANPWSRTISGTVKLVGPEGWRVSPAQSSFSIPAGESVTLPVQMVFPGSEVAGSKRLTAQLSFMADRAYRVDFDTAVEVGLRHIQLDAGVSYERDATTGRLDAIVTQFITNTGQQPVSLYAFAQTADFPRQEGVISRLNPGQSMIRRFRFEAVDALAGQEQPLRVGLRETRGPAVLNKLLRLAPPATTP